MRFALESAVLALLALAAPAAVCGQTLTLNSGDSLTVSSAGTAGIIGHTVYIPPNGMTTIAGTHGIAVQTNGTAAFTLAAGGALTDNTFNGGTLFVTGSGSVNITGGAITESGDYGLAMDVIGDGSMPLTISGGVITASGASSSALEASGNGSVDISGGTFTGGPGGYAILAESNGPVDITGGTFTAGQDGFGLETGGGIGVIDLFGTGFSYTVKGVTTPITSGALPTSEDGVDGTLNGTLLNGQSLNGTSFENVSTIEVNVVAPVPEPSQVATLSLGLFGLVGLRRGIRNMPTPLPR